MFGRLRQHIDPLGRENFRVGRHLDLEVVMASSPKLYIKLNQDSHHMPLSSAKLLFHALGDYFSKLLAGISGEIEVHMKMGDADPDLPGDLD
jgi:hypothetical protein